MNQLDRQIKRLKRKVDELAGLIEYQNKMLNNTWPVDAINIIHAITMIEDNKNDLALYRYMLDLLEERNMTNNEYGIELKLAPIACHRDYQNFGMFNDFANELHSYIAPRFNYLNIFVKAIGKIEVAPDFQQTNKPLYVSLHIVIYPLSSVGRATRTLIDRVYGAHDIDAIMAMPQPYREHQYAEFWNRFVIDNLFKAAAERFVAKGSQA